MIWMSQIERDKFRVFRGPSPIGVRSFHLAIGKRKMLIQAIFDFSRTRISNTSDRSPHQQDVCAKGGRVLGSQE